MVGERSRGVRAAVVDERLKDGEALPARVAPTVDKIDLSVEVDGAIELE
jgi:hypothetical protein